MMNIQLFVNFLIACTEGSIIQVGVVGSLEFDDLLSSFALAQISKDFV